MMPRRNSRSSSRSWYPIDRTRRGVNAARMIAITPKNDGEHEQPRDLREEPGQAAHHGHDRPGDQVADQVDDHVLGRDPLPLAGNGVEPGGRRRRRGRSRGSLLCCVVGHGINATRRPRSADPRRDPRRPAAARCRGIRRPVRPPAARSRHPARRARGGTRRAPGATDRIASSMHEPQADAADQSAGEDRRSWRSRPRASRRTGRPGAPGCRASPAAPAPPARPRRPPISSSTRARLNSGRSFGMLMAARPVCTRMPMTAPMTAMTMRGPGVDRVTRSPPGGRRRRGPPPGRRRVRARGARHPDRPRARAAARSRARGRADAAGSGRVGSAAAPRSRSRSRSSVRSPHCSARSRPWSASIRCSRASSAAGASVVLTRATAFRYSGAVGSAPPGFSAMLSCRPDMRGQLDAVRLRESLSPRRAASPRGRPGWRRTR